MFLEGALANNEPWRQKLIKLQAELAAKDAELAQLREDRARLDWLLKRGVCWRDANKEFPAEHWVIGEKTEWLYYWNGGRPRIDSGIDAAREGAKS